MRLLAIIPARKGSRRLPKKNLRLINNKPLVKWTIDLAKKIKEIDDIILSTDSKEIYNIGKKSGIIVPWLRPPNLSYDKVKSAEVALHALDWYENKISNVDAIVLLQPTSPFRKRKTVVKCIKKFKLNKLRPVITVSRSDINRRAQKNKPDGSVYIISTEMLKKKRNFMQQEAIKIFPNSQVESLDIDTFRDYFKAIKYAKNKLI